jgi:hypothetical protein
MLFLREGVGLCPFFWLSFCHNNSIYTPKRIKKAIINPKRAIASVKANPKIA